MTGKFKTEHDEYLWEGSVVSGVVTGSGSVDGPLGWYAPITLEPDPRDADEEERAALAHYGTRFLILHESNEGFVTVFTFDSEQKRNRRIIELDQALALHEAEVSDQQILEAITGYRRTLEWHAGHDGQNRSWSDDAHRVTGDEVTDFVTQNIEDLRVYMETLARGWQQIGGDFAFSRLRTGMGFGEFAGGEVADRLVLASHAWDKPVVTINEKSEMEVGS